MKRCGGSVASTENVVDRGTETVAVSGESDSEDGFSDGPEMFGYWADHGATTPSVCRNVADTDPKSVVGDNGRHSTSGRDDDSDQESEGSDVDEDALADELFAEW
jgi:hypothetical protein